RQAARGGFDLDLARHGRVADRAEHREVDHVIFAEALAPRGERARNRGAKAFAALQLDAMTLAVIEAERLDGLLALERPCEARGRVLAAGKQDERALGFCSSHRETP